MRIVQVTSTATDAEDEGPPTLAALRAGYRAAGHDTALVAPGRRDETVVSDDGVLLRVRSPRVPGDPGSRLLLDVRAAMRVLARLRPERLEVCGRSTLTALGGWARARGVPALALAHRRADVVLARRTPGWVPTRRLAAGCAAMLASRFSTVVCPSRWAAEEFTRLGLTNTALIPLGVDLATFHPVRRQASLRASLVGSDSLLLACVGPLTTHRRPALAIETLRCLLRRGVDARLVIAGVGPAEPAVRAAAADLPVTFLPAPTSPPATAALLASIDVLLCPAPGEVFGRTALEALAAGTPIVATRSGALGELLDDGEADLSSPPLRPAGCTTWSHPAAFATAVTGLTQLAASERRLAARAAAERFPWRATVEAMLALHAGERASVLASP